MSTKTISIMDEAYDLLKAEKKENESFSQVIIRHFQQRGTDKSILDCVGFLSEDDASQFEKHIKEIRKSRRRLY